MALFATFGACQSKKGQAPAAPKLADPSPAEEKMGGAPSELERDEFGAFDREETETIVDTTARASINEPLYHFGTAPQGMKIEHVFVVDNIGTRPLRLLNASATCGCTVPTLSSAPIPPGQSGEVRVVFDTQGKLGEQRKTVLINTDGSPAILEVMIVGKVTP